MSVVLTAAVLLLGPAALLWATHRFPLAARIGPIMLCYAVGLLLGVSGLLPESSGDLQNSIIEASLGLALPMLLFSVDMRAWGRVASRALVSMFLAIVAVVTVSVALFELFSARGIEDAEQLSGMAIGMYTGGIANMGAIKLALGIPEPRYLLFATVDTAIGALYLLFVLTVAPRWFASFLPSFGDTGTAPDPTPPDAPLKGQILDGIVAFVAAGLCVASAALLAPHVPGSNPQIMVIVLLTTFGLLGSFIASLRTNPIAPRIGMYLIYVFTFCIAASLDLTALLGLDMSILLFCLAAVIGTFLLHALLARLFKVDRDTFLITSVAAIMSPAFVPMVARALGNPTILMSGMAMGIFGFAIGNYLGISLALLLASGG